MITILLSLSLCLLSSFSLIQSFSHSLINSSFIFPTLISFPSDFLHSSPQPQLWMPLSGDHSGGAGPGSDLPSPFFHQQQLIESPIPEEAGEDHFGDEFTDFPRYDSRDIVYEEPQRQAKIVGERYLKVNPIYIHVHVNIYMSSLYSTCT